MWDESEVRAMGRDTMGVRGMTVNTDARVLGMEIATKVAICSLLLNWGMESAPQFPSIQNIIEVVRVFTLLL